MTAPQVLDGRYELGETLGSGGMATVYRGTDRVLNRPVAVKVLSPQYARDEDFVARFRREARAAANLNNPSLVSVYDTGSEDGRHYIVMELVEGRTLAAEIAEHGPLDMARAAHVAERVAAALQFAHANGIVHRDVKPGNVMLTPSGEVKVTDFGIARATGSDSFTTSSVLGTAAYLAPEQAESRPVDARTDVYALGVVLYEMLTGTPPFSGGTAVSVAYKHVREPPVPPTRVRPGIPPDLEAITMKAMAKDPAARYQSAEEMGADLARARGGEPVEAAFPGATQPMTGERTVAMAPVDATAVLAPGAIHEAPPEPPRERRRLWPLVLALVIVIVGAALAVALVAGTGGGGPAPGRLHRSTHPKTHPPSVPPTAPPTLSPSAKASPSQSPHPSPSPKPSATPPPSPVPSLSPSAAALGSPSPSPS